MPGTTSPTHHHQTEQQTPLAAPPRTSWSTTDGAVPEQPEGPAKITPPQTTIPTWSHLATASSQSPAEPPPAPSRQGARSGRTKPGAARQGGARVLPQLPTTATRAAAPPLGLHAALAAPSSSTTQQRACAHELPDRRAASRLHLAAVDAQRADLGCTDLPDAPCHRPPRRAAPARASAPPPPSLGPARTLPVGAL